MFLKKKFMNAFGFAENIGKVSFEHKNLLHVSYIFNIKRNYYILSS